MTLAKAGALDELDRQAIYVAAQMSESSIRTVEEMVRFSGQRAVGKGALGNVVTRFDSAKNKQHRIVESHTCELICAYELERDIDVLAYYAQSPCMGVERVREAAKDTLVQRTSISSYLGER